MFPSTSARWPKQKLVRFAFGGAITVIAGILVKRFGPVFGGLLLAFPAIFPASATPIAKHETEKKQKAGIATSSRGRQAAALDAAGAGTCYQVLVRAIETQIEPS